MLFCCLVKYGILFFKRRERTSLFVRHHSFPPEGSGQVYANDGTDINRLSHASDANNMALNDPKQLMDLELEYLIESSLSTTPSSSVHRQWYATTGYGSPYKMTYEEYIVSLKGADELALVFHASYERSNDTSAIKKEREDKANLWKEYFDTGVVPADLFK